VRDNGEVGVGGFKDIIVICEPEPPCSLAPMLQDMHSAKAFTIRTCQRGRQLSQSFVGATEFTGVDNAGVVKARGNHMD